MPRYFVEIAGHRLALTPGVWRIGRDPACEIRLADESVSRRHATLRVADEKMTIIDHGSRNGVRVDGDRIFHEIEVRPGNRLTVGSVVLVLGVQDEGRISHVPLPTQPVPRAPEAPVPAESPLEQLSPREREVFERLALGETQREVAEKLGLSVKTVETYRARIGEKLGLKTRADLVRIALEAGILRTPE